jgi:hypothetical protein
MAFIIDCPLQARLLLTNRVGVDWNCYTDQHLTASMQDVD